ncbi:hypothetical protein DFQ30_007382 [Apophysomyces sp. BC1015]|nr:hypothetical protein DFQ30_007382 [Apophysomyces sp. BC1015]
MPTDATTTGKAQRKRELKKNKDERKRARDAVLSKKDPGRMRNELSKLELQARSGQLDKGSQSRMSSLKDDIRKIEKAKKATGITGAQEALAARQQKQQQQQQDSRKLVYDPRKGTFVPVKKKVAEPKVKKQKAEDEDQQMSSSDSDSDSDSDISDSEDSDSTSDEDGEQHSEDEDAEDIPLPPGPPPQDSDDEDIPLPPGPAPPRPFQEQLAPIHAAQLNQSVRPLPPPPPPPSFPPPHFAGYYGMEYGAMPYHRPPPPPSYAYHPPQNYAQQPSITAAPSIAAAAPVYYATQLGTSPEPELPSTATKPTESTPAMISAEPQLRDLQKELLGFVPAALRRKQAAAKKTASLPKGARPTINAAPEVEDANEE